MYCFMVSTSELFCYEEKIERFYRKLIHLFAFSTNVNHFTVYLLDSDDGSKMKSV